MSCGNEIKSICSFSFLLWIEKKKSKHPELYNRNIYIYIYHYPVTVGNGGLVCSIEILSCTLTIFEELSESELDQEAPNGKKKQATNKP